MRLRLAARPERAPPADKPEWGTDRRRCAMPDRPRAAIARAPHPRGKPGRPTAPRSRRPSGARPRQEAPGRPPRGDAPGAQDRNVEPFAGSAAVLFAKGAFRRRGHQRRRPRIADAYRLHQSSRRRARPAEEAALGRRREDLRGSGSSTSGRGTTSSGCTASCILTHFSHGKMRGKSFSPTVVGVEATTIKRIEKFAPRLKKVKVYGGDYEGRPKQTARTRSSSSTRRTPATTSTSASEFDGRFFKLLQVAQGPLPHHLRHPGQVPRAGEGLRTSGRSASRTRAPSRHARRRQLAPCGRSSWSRTTEPTTKALDDEFVLDDWDGTLDDGADVDDVERRSPSARSAVVPLR